MKKLILGIFTAFMLMTNCEKEQKNNSSNTTSVVDHNSNFNSEREVENVTEIPEISPEKLAERMKGNINDKNTIHITNFFATWCGPCVKEIPHFLKVQKEYKKSKIDLQFVSVDERSDWGQPLVNFVNEKGMGKFTHTFAMDEHPEFANQHSKEWDGGSIPFTLITKGEQRIEILGMLSESGLIAKINSLD